VHVLLKTKSRQHLIKTHNEIVSFIQEDFEQQLNKHLKKHGVLSHKRIISLSSLSPLNRSVMDSDTSFIISSTNNKQGKE